LLAVEVAVLVVVMLVEEEEGPVAIVQLRVFLYPPKHTQLPLEPVVVLVLGQMPVRHLQLTGLTQYLVLLHQLAVVVVLKILELVLVRPVRMVGQVAVVLLMRQLVIVLVLEVLVIPHLLLLLRVMMEPPQ
jgi:hypothetical protein